MISEFRGENAFLSNFYPCIINAAGKVWTSAEHLYQAMKTEDENMQMMINQLKTAKEAKSFGRRVKLRENWDSLKIPFMRGIVERKFSQNPLLALCLIETGTNDLIEGNSWGDTFWGVCNGRGQNWLGKILMETREKLKVGL